MSPEAQRVAIAEACGWRVEPAKIQRGYNLITPDGKLWDSFWDNEAKEKTLSVADRWMSLPDYLNDLNGNKTQNAPSRSWTAVANGLS